jgi:hypothetical protein
LNLINSVHVCAAQVRKWGDLFCVKFF